MLNSGCNTNMWKKSRGANTFRRQCTYSFNVQHIIIICFLKYLHSSNTRPNLSILFLKESPPTHTHNLQDEWLQSTITLTPSSMMSHSISHYCNADLNQGSCGLIRVALVCSGEWGSCSTIYKSLVLYHVDGQTKVRDYPCLYKSVHPLLVL